MTLARPVDLLLISACLVLLLASWRTRSASSVVLEVTVMWPLVPAKRAMPLALRALVLLPLSA